ncbi:MAG: hypothetical protein A2735_03705 [Candidatus Yanofskybacteria bacterium RIFCSPHIGHO2_01_FULL_41_21]|uniref:DUF5667 domain-containing protein n=1 Tax=Candidatus Yanofskybacteria bacterium RIFCSPHIGHO2_01_FULL_41_21 TaxID=1802660 RepID=A0A1F8EAM5_9BACT|nr:MAG: hypothetical protein A2735_03705 [Candidatus Yanofskybacteria bacterium RIFCSPHIGHO2_01_FULL_41_21]
MDKNSLNIFNKVELVKLSSIEKEKMRAELLLFTEKHPVRNVDSIRHILQERSKSYISSFVEILTLKKILINKLQPMPIILIIALLVGGGTSFAAESALTGDVLYPVKVSVNEEVRGWFAVSSEAQAKWDARRVERRLEEAEKLAAEGRLNAEMRAQIESRLDGHSKAFEDQTKKIETEQNTNASLEINSDFEASLKAHEQVLSRIAAEKGNIRAEVESLLLEVRALLNTTVKARSNAEVKVSVEANGEFRSAAEGKLKAAENKISEARNFIEQMKSSVSASVSAQAEARLEVAESVVARGKAEIEAQTYGEAFASFQEAIRIAQEAKLLVDMNEKIELEMKIPDVDDDIEIKEETENESDQETSSEDSIEVESETEVKVDVGL